VGVSNIDYSAGTMGVGIPKRKEEASLGLPLDSPSLRKKEDRYVALGKGNLDESFSTRDNSRKRAAFKKN